MNFKLKK